MTRCLLVAVPALVVACTPFHRPPTPPLHPGATGRAVTRADAIVDLDALVTTFEDVHPDLYAGWPRDSAVAARSRLVAELPESMSRVEWWSRISPFVARFGDGHTHVQAPADAARREQTAGVLVFPPALALDDERHLVVSAPMSAGAALTRGERIVSVNNLRADSLVAAWSQRVRAESDTYRAIAVADAFRDYLLFDTIRLRLCSASKAPTAPRVSRRIAKGLMQAKVMRMMSPPYTRTPVTN